MKKVIRSYVEQLAGDYWYFLQAVWLDRGLNKLAPLGEIEKDIAHWAQYGPAKQGVLAPRGIGKTHFYTAGLVCWDLFRDPDSKDVIVSKSGGEAKKTLKLIHDWIRLVPFLQHLNPACRPAGMSRARDTTTWFDVAPAKEDRNPSVTAIGIEGQLPGLRAHRIIGDDVETPGNTKTLDARNELDELVREFTDIASYGERKSNFVGTYHHEESLYIKLSKRGYTFRTWPLIYPGAEDRVMGLSPMLQNRLDAGEAKPGDIVAPYRIDDAWVNEKKAEGRRRFAMQHQLVADLGDSSRYPLQLKDFIVFPCHRDKAPISISWGSTDHHGQSTRVKDIPSLGFGNDGYFAPIMFDQQWAPYRGTKMWIDPSGRGTNLTACAVVSHLNAYLWVKCVEGLTGGYEIHVLERLAQIAQDQRVQEICVEDNFGQGMFTQLFEPVLQRHFIQPGEDETLPNGWRCAVSSIRTPGVQKEHRIIDAIEPVASSHRIVMDRAVAANENLQRQITRITRQRDCLEQDDEIDALAACVNQWRIDLNQDTTKAAEKTRQDIAKKQLEQHYRDCGLFIPQTRYFNHQFEKPAVRQHHRIMPMR